MFIACRLAKGGYFNGSPSEVLKADVDVVISILNYETFENDYADVYNQINNEEQPL